MAAPTASEPRAAPWSLGEARFRALGHALVDRLAAWATALPQDAPVPADAPHTRDGWRALLAATPLGEAPLRDAGTEASVLLDAAAHLLLGRSPAPHHPRQFGYISAAPAPIAVLAELLAGAFNANVALWEAAPLAAEIEAQTIRDLADLLGAAAGTGGLLTAGGTQANAMALQLALNARRPAHREQGLRDGAPLAVYASDQIHGWLAKAVEQAGLGRRALRGISSDASQGLDLAALAGQIDADRAAGVEPLMVVGSAGTAATGAVDALPALAALCRREGLWFHVDGAYGAAMACLLGSPQAAWLGDDASALTGLREADSFAIDPHKSLGTPLEAGALLLREPARLAASFGEQPAYYTEPGPDDGPSYHRLGPQNSRGFRALKLALALRMAGRSGLRQTLADDLRLAARLADRIAATPGLELLTRRLGVVCFRYRPAGLDAGAPLDAFNRRLLAAVRRDGRFGLSGAPVGAAFALRACLVNPGTQAGDVDALPAIVAALGEELASRSPGG